MQTATFGGRTSSHHVDMSGLRLMGQSVPSVYHEKHDHKHPHQPELSQARTLDKKTYPESRVFVRKERQGFGGGFKILEEYRKNKLKRKGEKRKAEDEDDQDNQTENQVTKEEIFQLLNLGNAEGSIGAGKYGNSSKKALTNDLIEGLEKDLEKLKRFEENLRIRKLRTMKGGDKIINETDADRYKASIDALHTDLDGRGAHIVYADHDYAQVFRHKAGQLDSIKNLNLDELEAERLATRRQTDDLTEIYLQQKEQQSAGAAKMMRRKLGKSGGMQSMGSPSMNRSGGYDDPLSEDDEAQPVKLQNRQKNLRFNEVKHELDKDTPPTRSRSRKVRSRNANDQPPHLKDHDSNNLGIDSNFKSALKVGAAEGSKSTSALKIGRIERSVGSSKSRSAVGLRNVGARSSSSNNRVFRDPSPGIGGQGTNVRRDAFEAKFEKYRANKKQKNYVEKRAKILEQPDFDITTKNRRSPSKKAKKYTTVVGAELDFKPSGKFDKDYLLPEGYEETLMRQELLDTRKDPFKMLGVSPEDKMTFFLLKWVFDYIKQDSEDDDEELCGKAFVSKKDLVSQLSKNPELMNALDIKNKRELQDQVEVAASAKKGCLTWEEFLNYFFLRNATFQDRIDGDDWWTKLDQQGHPITDSGDVLNDRTISANLDGEDYDVEEKEEDRFGRKMSRGARLLKEFKEVPMTQALEFLMNTRKQKVDFDVENDFRQMQDTRATSGGGMDMMRGSSGPKNAKVHMKTAAIVDQDTVEAQLGISREKSKCLLLPSQIQTMKEEFEKLDKYSDGILKRAEFIKHLRMDMKVVDFIDAEAVQVASQQTKVLTLDQVFYEIERDEMYEMMQLSKQDDAINHKEFITWREFLAYFEDYKEIEERNKKTKQFQATRESMKQKSGADVLPDTIDHEQELKTLLEAEKERRLQALPKLRPQDQIDISEDQLKLIKGIFDAQQKVSGTAVNTVTFFMALRKNNNVRKILTAVARDPEGFSRLPRETFQQVFDRMEKDMQVKTVEWPTIIEYFTKLGRPLSKDEIKRLQDEDRRMKEEEAEIKRREEEQERRRMARLLEEVNENQEQQDALKPRRKATFDIDSDGGNLSDREDDKVFQGFDDSDEFDSDDEDDDLERDNDSSARIKRNRSARDFDRGNLGDKRITSEDYMHRIRSKSVRKGRYGVTVPEPFTFEIRDKQASQANIREKKVNEMVMEKKIEEENMIKHQFRHKPVPAAVLIPRYQQIQDKNEQRRMRVKQQSIEITKEREKPFSFWEREKQRMEKKKNQQDQVNTECTRPAFKANRMPDFSAIRIYAVEMAIQEEARLKRIHQKAKENYGLASMPNRMQQAAEDEKRKEKKPVVQEFSFKPMINEAVTGEQFKKRQANFQKKLDGTKMEKSTTIVKPWKFDLPENQKSKPLKLDYVNEGGAEAASIMKAATGGDKLKEKLAGKPQSAKPRSKMSGPPVKQPSSTRKDVLLQQRRREELEAKKAEEARKAKEDAERKARQDQMKSSFQAMMKPKLKSAQDQIEKNVKQKQADQRKAAIEAKEKKDQLLANSRKHPLLIDSYNTGTHRANNLAKAAILKNFVGVMKDKGLSDNYINGKFLSTQDQEILEEEKFIEARKQRYGKK